MRDSLVVVFSAFLCGFAHGFLPEEDMSVPEIIAYYGYPAEVVSVTTIDGYILQMHRIPFGVNDESSPRPVVFLQHGLLGSSADWVTNLPSQSLAFLLADAGFDVWMGNVRGNTYSIRHKTLDPASKEYWQFTWDEMSKYDLEAMINRVLNITEQEDLYYVGHSQGTLTMFAKLASSPKFFKKIRKFFALAPVATVGNITGLFRLIDNYAIRELHWLFDLFGDKYFFPSTWLTKLFGKWICGWSHTSPLCDNVLFQIAGPESNQLNLTRTGVYMTHAPAGTSTANIIHWSQMVRSNTVQAYDYGTTAANQQHYGKIGTILKISVALGMMSYEPNPPLYNLTLVNTPTYLYWSDADWLADSTDIQAHLLKVLRPEVLKLSAKFVNFNHIDFIWGLRAPKEIYGPIIEIMKQHENTKRRHRTTNRAYVDI